MYNVFLHKKISNDYLPLQPGLEINMDHYIELKQGRDPINQNITLIYQFKTNTDSVNSTFTCVAAEQGLHYSVAGQDLF